MEEIQEVDAPVDLSRWAAVYIKIRDKRAANKKVFEAEDQDLEEQMKVLAQEMLDVCKDMNADSIRTPHGTIMRSIKSRYWTNDWHSFHLFVKENEALELIEKRISQNNMASFLEENPDKCPPGLNVDSRYAVVVRRK